MLSLVKTFVLPYNAFMKIEQKIADLLISEKKSLSIAESCTGGLILKLGLVTYSNDSKIKLLKVPEETIKKHGAVSFQTTIAMAKGCKKILNTDFSIGLSGIAGPTGGTKSKPVGLVFIAICSNYETICLECVFTGTRSNIRSKASTQALKLLLEFL